MDEIKSGLYSDPPGFNFYTYELDKTGEVKKDKYGIGCLRCSRGTNYVESIHRQYNTTFRHKAGIEMGDALLAERRHRHNLDVAQRTYRDFPKVGHYDTWLVDTLQKVLEQNTGKSMFPGWHNVGDYEDTDESFITVPIHSEALQKRLELRVNQLHESDPGFRKIKLSPDVKFLCEAWGVSLPFLPVMRRQEYRLFSVLMLKDMDTFDPEKMSFLWMDYVDGREIYPKLGVQLRKYHRFWERNARIQSAVKKAKSRTDALDEYLSRKLPPEMLEVIETRVSPADSTDFIESAPEFESEATEVEQTVTLTTATTATAGRITTNRQQTTARTGRTATNQQQMMFQQPVFQFWQQPMMPLRMPLPIAPTMLRPSDAGFILVNGETIGTGLPHGMGKLAKGKKKDDVTCA